MKIYINKDQHLSDVLPVIPSNTILDKKITGCGATYGEIKADRHSIIIEPNVPVIKGKCSKPEHGEDNLLGVHEGVYREQVINYLHQSIKENKRFKILSTPESFQKVKEAFCILGVNMHEECFLLFDECHKIVKDVDYREDITLPFDDFFQFKSKALVSATPVKFSDPRFNTFKTVEVVPAYNIQKTINLYPTNNILETLKEVIQREGKICFFINSTDIIDSIMNTLQIKEESTVFCAPKSVERLNVKGFMNAHEDWKEESMKKYNFFTSRFYCALDIEMQERPTLVMVTDLYHATHTMLDPRTDVWQIIGRFRNGVSDVYHVTNFNQNLPVQSIADLKEQISIMEQVHDYLQLQYNHASSRNARIVYMETLKSHPYKKFLGGNDQKNWQLIDNYIDEGIVTSFYNSVERLLDGYNRCNDYKINYIKGGYHEASEKLEKLVIPSKFKSIKEKKRAIVEQLELIKDMDSEFKREWRDNLYSTDPWIVEAFELLGKETIEELGYSNQKIKEAIIVERYRRKTTSTAFIELMKNTFHVGAKYEVERVKNTILSIHEKLDIAPLRKVTANTINELFETRETWVGKASKRRRALYIVRVKV